MKAEQYTTAALVGAIIGFCWLAKKRKEKIGKLPYGKIRTKRYTKDALLHAQNVTVNDELYKKNGDWYISEALQQRTGVEQIKYKKDLDILLRAIKEQDNGFIVDHDEIIIEEAPVEDVPVVVEEAPAVVDVTPEQEQEEQPKMVETTNVEKFVDNKTDKINVFVNGDDLGWFTITQLKRDLAERVKHVNELIKTKGQKDREKLIEKYNITSPDNCTYFLDCIFNGNVAECVLEKITFYGTVLQEKKIHYYEFIEETTPKIDSNYNKKLYTEFSKIISKFDKNRKIVFYFTKEYIYCTDTFSCFKLPNESSQHSGTFIVDVENKFFRLTDEETKLTQMLVSFFEVEIPENAPAHEVQTFTNLLNVALEKEKVEGLLPGDKFNLGNFYFEMYGKLSIKIGNNYYPVEKLKKVMEVIKIGGGGTTLYNVDNYLICYNDRNDRAAIVSKMV